MNLTEYVRQSDRSVPLAKAFLRDHRISKGDSGPLSDEEVIQLIAVAIRTVSDREIGGYVRDAEKRFRAIRLFDGGCAYPQVAKKLSISRTAAKKLRESYNLSRYLGGPFVLP